MTRTEIERLAVIETKFETIIEPMALQVQMIHDQIPEIIRKVNASHTFINDLKADGCPKDHIVKRESDGNGGYKERRTKKSWRQQWGEVPLAKKVTTLIIAIPFVGAYWEWILSSLHKALSLLQTLSK